MFRRACYSWETTDMHASSLICTSFVVPFLEAHHLFEQKVNKRLNYIS